MTDEEKPQDMVTSHRYKTNFAKIADSLRNDLGQSEEPTDSTDLHLTRDEFMQRMHREKDGQQLLDLMEDGEYIVCERLGLCDGYYEGDVAYIDVPRWNNLVQHLRIVNSV